jgi:outer membrane protein assembly factor BamB|tara:strand:+ start:998 stop:2302 length:1305 start_codon:yes stop_codon:yes gene_type:complete
VIKISILSIILFIFISNCSFSRSGFWTENENFEKTNIKKTKLLFEENKVNTKEFNQDFIIKTPLRLSKIKNSYQNNNNGTIYINENLNKVSRYSFAKIKNFSFFNPELIFENENLIFFDKKGSIIKFNERSKIVWKINHYSKKEKKLPPVLNFSSNEKILIVTDSLSNYYAIDLISGDLKWKKNHNSIFISDIKIDEDKFYVVDSNSVMNCFSLITGKKIWNFNTDNDLIKSQKKLSIVFDKKKVYFNNLKGEIYSLNKNNGNLIWITPTNNDNSIQSFMIKNSKLVLDNTSNNIFFSNNLNNFFSIDANNGFINWKQIINSDLTPVISKNLIFSISLEGYFYIVDKSKGNIIRITDIFKEFSKRKRKKIFPIGFVSNQNYIYLSLNNGKILEIDISNGKHVSTLKISRDKISKPFINNGQMFIVNNNSITKLN